jgi:hypothetical protein
MADGKGCAAQVRPPSIVIIDDVAAPIQRDVLQQLTWLMAPGVGRQATTFHRPLPSVVSAATWDPVAWPGPVATQTRMDGHEMPDRNPACGTTAASDPPPAGIVT